MIAPHTPPRRKPFRIAIATAAAAALLLSACSSGDSASDMEKKRASDFAASDINETPRDELQDGGTLTTAISEIPEQLNIFHANSTRITRDLWRWYNPLMVLFNGEGEFSPNPDYLSDVTEEIIDGNTVVTYEVVDEAVFNDGTPIDWTAFKTTWIINSNQEDSFNPGVTNGFDRVLSVTPGKTPKQAVITFKGIYPWWQKMFLAIAHPALRDPANYHDYLDSPHPEWGAGPFKIEHFDAQRGDISFVPNEKWWGDKPKLERRSFRSMEDSAELNAFRNGEIDAALVASKDRYETVQHMKGVDVRTAPHPKKVLITLNAETPALKDIRVREAIARGIDRDQVRDIIFNGIPYSENPPGSLVFFSTQPEYEDNFRVVVPHSDPEAARSLLDEAGWTQDGDGTRTKDGETLSLRYTLLGDDPARNAMATAIQAMLRDIGIDLQIETRPSSDFSKVFTTNDFEILPVGFTASDPYGATYFRQTYGTGSQLNRSNTGSAEFDEKLAKLDALPSREEQVKRVNELEKEAFKFFGVIPMYNGPDMVAVKERLANYGAPGFGITPPEDIGWVAE